MKALKKKNSLILCFLFVLGTLANTSAMAVTPEEIETSIQAGIEWLVAQQDPGTGQWQDVPRTGFVLIKLQDRAYELGKDPFETDPAEDDYYEYATNVIAGWQYLFAVDGNSNPLYARKENISDQNHVGGASGTVDDPDTRVNGYGIYFSGRSIYNTGICLMALAASRAPGRVNDGGIDYDGDSNADTFGEIAQDVVDWLAFAQADSGNQEGAYSYSALNNGGGGDNSNAGYAYLGLAAAEGFSCTVPDWVKTELNVWIDYVQNDPGAADDDGGYCNDEPDGGSGYGTPARWVNELKTGNLIFEMTFYGDDPTATRFQNAMDYIERHWQDPNLQPGWGYNQPAPAHYQAIYCLMKGLEYSQIDLIDLDGNNVPEHDWFDEFATVLLAQQQGSGSWPSSPCYVWYCTQNWGTMSGEVLSTVWALLTLEKIAPPPPVITVDIDIKPQSCPNPLNVNNNGLLPVAILGSAELDVTTIDVASIRLADVAPIRSSFEDVAAPIDGEECECTTEGPDGYLDLTLKFGVEDIADALGEVVDGEVLALTLTGELSDGMAIEGADCIRVKKPRAKRPK